MSITAIIAKANQHKDSFVEDSIALRVVTTALAITGVLAASPLTEAPFWLIALSVFGSVLGSYVSYKRRYKSGLVVKIFLSIGIIIAAVLFFNEIIVLANQNVADARVPLTKLLMVLIALHCFDVPRRRDLSVSFLVGFTLMAAASTLSRDLIFAAYLFTFMTLTMIMFQCDCASRSLSRAKILGAGSSSLEEVAAKFSSRSSANSLAPVLIQTLLALAIFSGVSLGIFLLAPKLQLNLSKEFRLGLNLPFQIQSDFLNKLADSGSNAANGIVHPENAYFGFAEEFDTNYRGKLSDAVVLRVLSKVGLNLRGMAYDNFDGKVWRMSRPKETRELLAREDHGFNMDLRLTPFYRVHNSTITQMIYVEQDSSNLIVAASSPYQLYFPSSAIQVDTYGSLRSPVGMQKDMVYSVFSQVPNYNFDVLRTANDTVIQKGRRLWKLKEEDEKNYLQLPPMLQPGVAQLSSKIAGKGNNFFRAERISRFLQTHYDYDLDIEMTPDGRDSVSDFLLYSHRGFCEHFASALAVMCRTQGIPARLVTGYTCGQYNPFTGFWEVRLRDAHSWVEVFSPRFGWIPLDATPDAPDAYGEAPQSAFAYLEKLIKPVWLAIWHSGFVQSAKTLLVHGFNAAFSVCFASYVQIRSHAAWNFGVIIALLGAMIFLYRAKLVYKIRHFSASALNGGRDRVLVNSEASKEYIKLGQALEEVGVIRGTSETPTELLEKTRNVLDVSRSAEQEFLRKLSEFLELYSQIRFGGDSSELPKLKNLNQNLAEMSRNLSQT